jgi:diadenosine tetraphosphate (Ap4A) HIT family hydrolase
MTLFEKIIAREIPADIVYEDESRDRLPGHSSAGADPCPRDPAQTDPAGR